MKNWWIFSMAEAHIMTDMVPANEGIAKSQHHPALAVMFRHGETLRFAPKTFQTNATPVTRWSQWMKGNGVENMEIFLGSWDVFGCMSGNMCTLNLVWCRLQFNIHHIHILHTSVFSHMLAYVDRVCLLFPVCALLLFLFREFRTWDGRPPKLSRMSPRFVGNSSWRYVSLYWSTFCSSN